VPAARRRGLGNNTVISVPRSSEICGRATLTTFTHENVPRRMSFRVIMPFQISTWFIHYAPVGVK
jgi:hypothetical protein